MTRVTAAEIMGHHVNGQLFKEGDNINLLSIAPNHADFPKEPINPRTKLKYGKDTMANIQWRYAVRKLLEIGHNTVMTVLDHTGEQQVVKFHRDTINQLANNAVRAGEVLEVTVEISDRVSLEENKRLIHDKVADLLTGIPVEIELLELGKCDSTHLLRKLKHVTVIPAPPFSLLYAHSPIPVQIKLKRIK